MSDDWKFTASDFRKATGYSEYCAASANAKLAEWIAAAPVVYAHQIEGTKLSGPWTGPSQFGDTHTAKLVQISLIVRDTHESLLRELLRLMSPSHGQPPEWVKLRERAERLLDGGE